MRIILLEDVENVGKKFEVKDVKDGYARNFLIPKGLAKLATKQVLELMEKQREAEKQKAEEELKEIQKMASSTDGLEVIVPVKVGDEQQLFEKINTQKISEKLKEMGFEIKKGQIDLIEPIGEIGEFPIKVKFEHNLESEIIVIVTEEK